jgi:hypothetical protein
MKILITVEVPDGASVVVGTTEVAAEAPAKKAKKAPAPEPAPPAAAPAPVAAPPAAETPTLAAVNAIVSKLAGMGPELAGHTAARKILTAHGASTVKTSTSQLKAEVYQTVIDETEEAIARLDAAATQVANSGSLV